MSRRSEHPSLNLRRGPAGSGKRQARIGTPVAGGRRTGRPWSLAVAGEDYGTQQPGREPAAKPAAQSAASSSKRLACLLTFGSARFPPFEPCRAATWLDVGSRSPSLPHRSKPLAREDSAGCSSAAAAGIVGPAQCSCLCGDSIARRPSPDRRDSCSSADVRDRAHRPDSRYQFGG